MQAASPPGLQGAPHAARGPLLAGPTIGGVPGLLRRPTTARGRPPWRYRSLFGRIFLVNAAVLGAASVIAVLVFSPGTVSSGVAVKELAIFAGALLVMVSVDLVVTRRMTAPLDELVMRMRAVDPLRRGQRVPVVGRPSEAAELAQAFNEMLGRLEDERAESTRRALHAQESERLRVAQELHDEIGQNLTAALLQIARLRRRAPAELQDELSEGAETVRESLEELRRIAQRLRPQDLEELGLLSAVTHFAARLGEQAGLPIARRLDRELPPLTREQELVVYRVAQEALTNVIRHAGASRAELALTGGPEAVTLRVRDDGAGLDGTVPGGGIRGMHERALLVDADLHVGPARGGGTEVVLRVPLAGGEGA